MKDGCTIYLTIIMAIQYRNIIKFVEPHGFTVRTNEEEYKELDQKNRTILFECPFKHEMRLGHAVYINKKSKFLREKLSMKDFCSVCVSIQNKKEAEDGFIEEIENQTGHLILELDNQTREVIYQCGMCGEKNHSYIQNMKNNTGVCHHCQNEQFKVTHDDLKQRVEEKGLVLSTKEGEYDNNKNVFVTCKCGTTYKTRITDIRRGRMCVTCKPTRSKTTCMLRYGEDNVSKVPYIYDKIMASSFCRKEFMFPITRREVIIMGYEPQAIMYLLAQKEDPLLGRTIEEDEIRVGKEVPRIRYHTDDGKEHIYFPDLFIKDTKIIIEIKSDYTFHYHPRLNYLKGRKVVEEGYTFRLMIFNKRMEVADLICRTVDECQQIKEY